MPKTSRINHQLVLVSLFVSLRPTFVTTHCPSKFRTVSQRENPQAFISISKFSVRALIQVSSDSALVFCQVPCYSASPYFLPFCLFIGAILEFETDETARLRIRGLKNFE